ncbi:MAG TPA: head GIN domain-containing protein [Flavipsychrobacter sp.]|nr:head GIN domain-containing protein [Flavipsychrobacter sp.]
MRNVLVLCLLTFLIASSCGRRTITGKGESTTMDRTISENFSAISIEAPLTAKIHVRPGIQSSVQFTGYKNIIEEIRTKVEQNTLVIEGKHSIDFDTDKDILAEITVGSLSELSIHGAADAKVDGAITGSEFNLVISGAGDVTVEKINVTNLNAKISGAGNVILLAGNVSTAEYKVSGAGNINSFGIQANNVKAKVSGAGDIDVYASQTLEAKVSGAGTIQYKGNASVKSETSGIGSIIAAN